MTPRFKRRNWSDLRSTGGDSEVISDGDGKRSISDGDITLFTCSYHLTRSASNSYKAAAAAPADTL